MITHLKHALFLTAFSATCQFASAQDQAAHQKSQDAFADFVFDTLSNHPEFKNRPAFELHELTSKFAKEAYSRRYKRSRFSDATPVQKVFSTLVYDALKTHPNFKNTPQVEKHKLAAELGFEFYEFNAAWSKQDKDNHNAGKPLVLGGCKLAGGTECR